MTIWNSCHLNSYLSIWYAGEREANKKKIKRAVGWWKQQEKHAVSFGFECFSSTTISFRHEIMFQRNQIFNVCYIIYEWWSRHYSQQRMIREKEKKSNSTENCPPIIASVHYISQVELNFVSFFPSARWRNVFFNRKPKELDDCKNERDETHKNRHSYKCMHVYFIQFCSHRVCVFFSHDAPLRVRFLQRRKSLNNFNGQNYGRKEKKKLSQNIQFIFFFRKKRTKQLELLIFLPGMRSMKKREWKSSK